MQQAGRVRRRRGRRPCVQIARLSPTPHTLRRSRQAPPIDVHRGRGRRTSVVSRGGRRGTALPFGGLLRRRLEPIREDETHRTRSPGSSPANTARTSQVVVRFCPCDVWRRGATWPNGAVVAIVIRRCKGISLLAADVRSNYSIQALHCGGRSTYAPDLEDVVRTPSIHEQVTHRHPASSRPRRPRGRRPCPRPSRPHRPRRHPLLALVLGSSPYSSPANTARLPPTSAFALPSEAAKTRVGLVPTASIMRTDIR